MSLFNQLTKRFETINIKPYGNCIVIPNSKYQYGWREQLQKEQLKPLHNKKYIYIPIKNKEITEKYNHKERETWTKPEIEKLLKTYNQLDGTIKSKIKYIHNQGILPKHTLKAIRNAQYYYKIKEKT